jgi:hypothetical protein
MEYWWEGSTSTAISPASASDLVGHHNKIGGVNVGATLVNDVPLAVSFLWLCSQFSRSIRK